MSEFNIESESIDVERIMAQIRARIAEKRTQDYTEEQIRELASVKLEGFLDPSNVRSGMVEFYKKRLKEKEEALRQIPEAPQLFEFDPDIIYRSSRGVSGRILYTIRKLLNPLLKFFFNPAPVVHALTLQQRINERQAEVISHMVRAQAEYIEIAALNYEVMNNLVVEMTRLALDMKNHRMRVESVAGRLDFDERRARALEKVVKYRDDAPTTTEGGGAPEKRRRRRRRGSRRPTETEGGTSEVPTTNQSSETTPGASPTPGSDAPQEASPTAQNQPAADVTATPTDPAAPSIEQSPSSVESGSPTGDRDLPADEAGSSER